LLLTLTLTYMEVLTRNSRVPDNHVFQQIQSPMAISVAKGIYDHYVAVCDAIVKFSKQISLIPYDQTLGGRYVEYLMSFENHPEDSVESKAAVSAIMDVWELYDDLCDINMAAAEGRYITPVVRRDDSDVTRASISSFATGVAKDCLVSLLPAIEGVIADICGRDSAILDTFTRLGQSFATYVNVDLDPNALNSTFLANKKKFEIENDDHGVIVCKHLDANEFIRQQEDIDSYISIHSIYHVDNDLLEKMKCKRFCGVAHFSDLLFLESDCEADDSASLVKDELRMTGSFGAFSITKEPLSFVNDVGFCYPLRFLNNVRATMHHSTIVSKTLAMWSTNFPISNRRIASFPGCEYRLRPVMFNKKFRRAKIYDIDEVDFYYLRRMGFYISAKIDGLCGFISNESGIYYLSLRDGRQFQIFDTIDRAVNFGYIEHTLNVEVVVNPKTGNFQFWFVGYSPPYYPSIKSEKRYYWQRIFTPWAAQVEKAKMSHAGLFFKNYLWVEPDSNVKQVFDIKKNLKIGDFDVPIDGVLLHDPYGNFVGFWKPWRTADVTVDYSELGLFTVVDGRRRAVVDKSCRFINSGVYEVYVDDGEIFLLQPRTEKTKSGDLELTVDVLPVFNHDYESVEIAKTKVLVQFQGFKEYFDNYGRNYIDSLSRLSPIKMEFSVLKLLFESIVSHLKRTFTPFEGGYLVSDWVSSITAITTYPVSNLWGAFLSAKFCKSGPYQPEIRLVNNSFRALIYF